MLLKYEIKNKRLKELVEKKAEEFNTDVDDMIWCYVNRGLMSDTIDLDRLEEFHSEERYKEINKALGLD